MSIFKPSVNIGWLCVAYDVQFYLTVDIQGSLTHLKLFGVNRCVIHPFDSVFLKLINRKNILPLWKGKTPVVIYSMLCSCSIILYGGKCWIRDTFLLRDGNYWFVIWCGVVADKAVSKGYMLCVAMLWNCFPHLPLAPLPRWTWEEGDLFKGCAMKYKWQEINHLSAHVSLPAQR